MATEAQPVGGFQQAESSSELASQWRRLTRAATAVALITAPAVVVWLNQTEGWSWFWSILATLGLVVCFRGVIDILFHRLIPRPSLFGLESQQLREEDVVTRRRVGFGGTLQRPLARSSRNGCEAGGPAMGRAGIEPATLGLKVPCSTD